jgi:hypothetical protein
MQLRSDSFQDGARIPAEFAFGMRGDADTPIALSANRSPHLAWSGVPEGTQGFVLACVDEDVPTVRELVNRKDATIPAEQPRGEFVHWVMVDVAAGLRELAAGACGEGVVARGKRQPPGPAGSRQGLNDYTGFFADDPDMAGDYLGYDGPCPPFNDQRVHRYFFRVFALDVPKLDLPERFTARDAFRAMHGHVLAEAALHGTYTTNAALA